MSQSKFISHTPDTAPSEMKPIMEGTRAQFGFIPDPMAKLVSSPAAVEAFLKGNAIFEKSAKLSPLEREVLIMTVGTYNGCHYCVAMHSAILTQMEAPAALIEALRSGTRPSDPRLGALASFTRQVLETRGEAGDAAIDEFFAAGYSQQQALDVILGVSIYTLTTYANRLTGASLDAPFEAFRWEGSGAAK